ncbi:hypothetical protein IHE55_24845 [Streptomyces pactum]|uniref:Uncharacterized protein n=1 Tax=Streptomyces pactum TaxID=68249 RepID=A0ABS0NRR2_9ACTN|nr:hypothetical protein [Streptomyces pactum]MBH5337831.1 hypothetical protein [Streptomyces pactum]
MSTSYSGFAAVRDMMGTDNDRQELLDRLAGAVGPVPPDVVDGAKALFARLAAERGGAHGTPAGVTAPAPGPEEIPAEAEGSAAGTEAR